MIHIWYDVCWQVTYVSYQSVRLCFPDRDSRQVNEETAKLLADINDLYEEYRVGVGVMDVPYSDELWGGMLKAFGIQIIPEKSDV
jgi:hypothetical protein